MGLRLGLSDAVGLQSCAGPDLPTATYESIGFATLSNIPITYFAALACSMPHIACVRYTQSH